HALKIVPRGTRGAPHTRIAIVLGIRPAPVKSRSLAARARLRSRGERRLANAAPPSKSSQRWAARHGRRRVRGRVGSGSGCGGRGGGPALLRTRPPGVLVR